MKTIFVVSPDFLDSILEEAKHYQFALQGYGNFKKARERVRFVNQSDLIGIAFVANKLPSTTSKEWKWMMVFFDTVNKVFPGTNVKFVVKEKVGGEVKELRRFSNLSITLLDDVEAMTDVVLNKDLFGSLLVKYYSPYGEEERAEQLGRLTLPDVTLKPLFVPPLLALTTPVSLLFTLDVTLEKDEVYQQYKEDNWLVATLREIQVKKLFQLETDELMSDVRKFVEDNQLGGEFQAIIHLIEKGVF